MKKPWDLSKAVIFSDIHIHPWEELSRIENLINTRLMDGINVLKMITNYAIKKRIKYVFFGGDLYHKRNEVNVVATALIKEALQEAKEAGLEVWLMSGNHDQAFNTKYDALTPFEECANIVRDHRIINVKGFGKVSFHPWNDNRLIWRNDYINTVKTTEGQEVVLSVMHFDFQNIEYRGNYVGSGAKTNLLGDHALAVSGHYHDFISDRRVLYCGSPMHHNWGDAGKDRGFLVVKIESSLSKNFHRNFKGIISWRRVINEETSRFVEIFEEAQVTKSNIQNNFVRIYKNMFTVADYITVWKKVESFNPREIQVIDLPNVGTVEEVDIENYQVRNVEDILKDYVKTSGTPLDQKKLIQFGKEFLHNTMLNRKDKHK